MQTRLRSPLQSRNVTTYSDLGNTGAGSTSSSVSNVAGYRDEFSFSGFGSGDKRRKRIATPGSYHRLIVEPCRGSKTLLQRNVSSNPIGRIRFQNVEIGAFEVVESCSPALPNPLLLDPAFDSAVYNRALSSMYDKLRASEANLAVSLGEAGETGRMLRKALDSITQVVTWARRAKRQAIQNPSKTISEIWLSYKYGWLPLYNDVYAYLNWASRHFDEMTFEGYSRRREDYAVAGTSTTTSSPQVPCKWSQKGVIEQKCRVSVTCAVSDTLAFDRSRITSLNPLSVAWELVPLSFVADWFIDVGGYLQNMEAALGSGLTFKRGYYTQVVVTNLDITHSYDHQFVSTILGAGGPAGFYSKGKLYRARKQRVLLSGFPRPQAPRFSVSLGWQRIISAAALIRTILLGRVK